MIENIKQYAKEMLENFETFLPIDKAMNIRGVEIESHMSYLVYYEELENDYHSDKKALLDEYQDFYGEDYHKISESEDDFEVEVCNAPTYIELLKWISEQ